MAISFPCTHFPFLSFPFLSFLRFAQVFLSEDMVPAKILFDVAEDRERVTQLIVRVWHAMHYALTNLRTLISTEIDSTGILFLFLLLLLLLLLFFLFLSLNKIFTLTYFF